MEWRYEYQIYVYVWREVPNYFGWYEVVDAGSVLPLRSLDAIFPVFVSELQFEISEALVDFPGQWILIEGWIYRF